MSQPHSIKHRWLPAMALLYCLPGLAATVYKTVDEDGMASFSDIKPAGNNYPASLVRKSYDPKVRAAFRK